MLLIFVIYIFISVSPNILELLISRQLTFKDRLKIRSLYTARKRMRKLKLVRVPTQTGKPEKWEGIFQSGKSPGILYRLEKSGKITQNTGKLREFEIDII